MTTDDDGNDNGAKVIRFPIKHCRPKILSKDIAERENRAKAFYVGEITAQFIEQAATGFFGHGIDVNDPQFSKDFAYFQLTVAGIFCRSAGIPHMIHDAVAAGVSCRDDEGNEGYIWASRDSTEPPVSNMAITTSDNERQNVVVVAVVEEQ